MLLVVLLLILLILLLLVVVVVVVVVDGVVLELEMAPSPTGRFTTILLTTTFFAPDGEAPFVLSVEEALSGVLVSVEEFVAVWPPC